MTTRSSNSKPQAVTRLSLTDAIGELGGLWWEILRESGAELFLSPEWVRSTASATGLETSVEVFFETRNGRLQWLCPLLRRRRRIYGLDCVIFETPGDTLVAYHNDLLSRAPLTQSLTALVGSLADDADLLLIPAVVEGSPLEEAVGQLLRSASWSAVIYQSEASPYLPIESSWDEFLASKSSNFRYSIRRKQRALGKKGELEERWFTSSDDVEPLLSAMLHIESASWKVDADMAISGRSVEQRYYGKLLPFLAEKNALMANGLFLDSEPIAYSLCYAWGGKLGQLKTSFSEAYSNQSPGLVVNNAAIRRAFESGFSEFDFLGDVMPHKMHWTRLTRPHNHYFLFAPTLRMRALRAAKALVKSVRDRRARQHAAGRGAHRLEKRQPSTER